ncbi:MAG TPA: cytochrome ubiquinol oxidase subunit I [Chlamydiales bacterium]|nr:cytochrome ubiquinol oxidase subunit I [Chlamydiales bacterium]
MGVEILSRIQFAFTLTFHYIYPPLSIGLSLALIFMEGMYLKTKDPIWERLTKFWVKVFSLTFALGVATGIPLQFSLGTNWGRYSRFVGDVFGSLLGAEGFFAFLVEAGFLGILLFGWNRVKPPVHFLATIFVSLGAHFSAIWIVSANSWMQYPSGYKLATAADGVRVAQVTDWWEMFLSPTNLSHLGHVILSSWMAGAFLIVSVSAYYLLKNQYLPFAKKSMKLGLLFAIITSILQLLSADNLARKVSTYNPEKFASLEGVYETKPHTPAFAFGWVDEKNQKVYGLSAPGLLSYLTYRNFETPIKGLDQFPKDHWPMVNVVFQMYHLMIAMWGLMFLASVIGIFYWWKKKLVFPKLALKFLIISVVFPQIANISGWYTSCMGRQPWTVYKLLKTSEGYSAGISRGQVIGSLIMFVCLYLLFLVLFLVLLDQKIKNGPKIEEEQLPYRDIFKEEEKA